MKKLRINIDGQETEVWAQKIQGHVWFHYQGQTHQYTPAALAATQNSSESANNDPTQITAPMPGKIIKVFVQSGDSVKEGQTLVAMEAMKMEYNLKAAKDMKVTTVLASANSQVNLGDLLVKLEEEDV